MALAFNNTPMPVRDAISRPRDPKIVQGQPDPAEGLISTAWMLYFTQRDTVLNQNPTRLNAISLTGRSASIGATDFSGGTLNAGIYRISYYTRVTQAAGVSSSLTVTFGYTDGGVAQSDAGAAMNGNTTTTHQSGTYLIRTDSGSPVTYATTYATAGVPDMVYSLYITLEQVWA